MIYATNSAVDKQLLNHSRALVRRAMARLRKSDHLVSASAGAMSSRKSSASCPAGTGRRPDAAADLESEQMREGKPGGDGHAQGDRGVR